jgi:hypothetical protein
MARWLDGSMARWLDGSMARWLDGSMARWLGEQPAFRLAGKRKIWIDVEALCQLTAFQAHWLGCKTQS